MPDQIPNPETGKLSPILEKLHESGVVNLDVTLRQVLEGIGTVGITPMRVDLICDTNFQCFAVLPFRNTEQPPES